jgi:hypothetical protein
MPSTWVPREGQTYTIAVDFDGVIHDYHKGWHDGTIYGSMMPGAEAALCKLMEKYSVFIFTAREPEAVMPWLEMHGFDVTIDERCGGCGGEGALYTEDPDEQIPCKKCKGSGQLMFWNLRGQLLVTNRKLAAAAYIDDRGIRFESWGQSLADLEAVL